MKNAKVCHAWAHQTKPCMTVGNVGFYGSKIWSYGDHFSVARHATDKHGKPCVLFTTRDYSSTTGQHKSAIRCSIPNSLPVFYMQYPENEPNDGDIRDAVEKLNLNRARIMRKTKGWQWDIDRLNEDVEKVEDFAKAFKLHFKDTPSKEWKQFLKDLPEKIQKQENREQWLKDHPTEANLAAEKRRTKALAAKQANFEEEVGEWFAGTRYQFPAMPKTRYVYRGGYRESRECYLRILPGNDVVVQTSLNATVPREHVERALPLVLKLIAEGKGWKTNGHTIHLGPYQLDEITPEGDVRAGCHLFRKSEVLRFAEVLKGVKNEKTDTH